MNTKYEIYFWMNQGIGIGIGLGIGFVFLIFFIGGGASPPNEKNEIFKSNVEANAHANPWKNLKKKSYFS